MRSHLLRSANKSSVSLLLHGDGPNNSTAIIDSSRNGFTPTITGDAKISTSQSKFGGASIAFDGSGDRLTYPASSAWNLSGGPHTIEFFVRLGSYPGSGNSCRVLLIGPNNNASSFTVQISQTGQVIGAVPFGGKSYVQSSGSLSLNTWQHVAVVINGTSSGVYIDGVQTTGTIDAPDSSSSNPLYIGYDTVGTVNSQFNGFLDELRISRNVARYSSAFTPPASPFPDE